MGPEERLVGMEHGTTEYIALARTHSEAPSMFMDIPVQGPGSLNVQAIPRTIHYVWFGGGDMPEGMRKTVAGWRRVMPECGVVEWNERNLDVNGHPWMARMHAEGRYAFASDYARLMVLYECGGIYLDTDVQIKKDITPFLGEQCLWSFEFDSFLSTCIIASVPRHPLIGALLKEYDKLADPVVNNDVVTRFFLREFREFRLNNKDQRVGANVRVMPKEYFIVPSFDDRKNFAVHGASNQWKEGGRRLGMGRIVRALIGDVLFYKLVNLRMSWRSEYLAIDRARHGKD